MVEVMSALSQIDKHEVKNYEGKGSYPWEKDKSGKVR